MEYSRCFNPTKINKNKSTIRKEEEKANYSIKLLFHTMKFLGSLVIELIWCMQLSVYDDGADDGLQNIS